MTIAAFVDKYNEEELGAEDAATMAAPPGTPAATTLGTASRLLGADDNNLHKVTNPVIKVTGRSDFNKIILI